MNELLTFPCEFSIKVMGLACDTFELAVLSIIKKHVSDLREDAIKTRPSKDGKYISLTITFTATSQAHIDAIYIELSASEHTLFTL